MLAETILGKTRAEVAHNRIARDLCDHTRGGNAQAVAVTIDDGGLGQGKRKNGKTVDERVLGLHRESGDRRAHRFMSGAQNIDRVDLYRINNPDRPENGTVRGEILVNLLAFFWQQLFGIVQPPVAKFFGKNDGGGDYWTGESAAPRFVDAGDGGDTERAQFAFVPETTTTVHRGENTGNLKCGNAEINPASQPLRLSAFYSRTAVASLPLRVRR